MIEVYFKPERSLSILHMFINGCDTHFLLVRFVSRNDILYLRGIIAICTIYCVISVTMKMDSPHAAR